MIESIANRELGITEAQNEINPLLLRLYGEGATVEKIDADIAKGETLVQDARESHGMSRNCE